jgi:hypothetical protein
VEINRTRNRRRENIKENEIMKSMEEKKKKMTEKI